ncbi:RDD family protein [Crocosphaera sp.]|uniref:RDD family protein n=1 Tax=Crocosphaera sp. TaxID=2729996 RepID=UPI003F22BDCE|nr:RDD family protein [Crocosphaera sp.]
MNFFNQFKIQTPESVELEFTLAGIGNRVYAFAIDWIVLGFIITVLLIFAALSFLNSFLVSSVFGIPEEQTFLWILAIQFFIIFVVYVGYFVFFETLWQGETPGKRFVKIRVIQDNGRPIMLQQATLRALLRPIDDLFFLGVFFIVFGKQEKRIGDWVAGTIVIQEEQGKKGTDLTVSKAAENLANYLQKNADLSNLLPEDFATIRRYLQRRDGMFTQARVELARKLAYQVKDIINLQEIPENTTSNLFLEAVYLAYQQQG